MKCNKALFFSLIVIMTLTAGCLIGGTKELTIKQWGDRLEMIPLGKSMDYMKLAIPEFKNDGDSIKIDKRTIGCFASLDPLSNEYAGLKIYRQYPRGVLLRLENGDFFQGVPVRDGFESTANLVVFFNASGSYKGYFGYSFNRVTKDSTERLEAEKQSFKDMQISEKLAKEVKEFKETMAYRGKKTAD